MTVSVCLSICKHISSSTCPIFTQLFVHVTYAVVRSSSGALWYVYLLPVLRTTSFLHTMARNRRRSCDSVGSSMDYHRDVYSKWPTKGSTRLEAESDIYYCLFTCVMLWPCVCLSVCHKSVFRRNGWTDPVDFWRGTFLDCPTVFYKEILVSPKIRNWYVSLELSSIVLVNLRQLMLVILLICLLNIVTPPPTGFVMSLCVC